MYIVFGPVWAISLPEIGPMIQGDSPEIVEHVLNSIFRAYDKGLILKGDMDIFGSDGTRWRFQRKLASHIFTVRAFKEYVSEVFVNEGYKVIKYLGNAADQGALVDFHQLMLHYTVSFGKSFGCLENIDATCSDLLVDPAWRIRERLTSAGAKAQHDKNLIAQHAYALLEKRRTEGSQCQGDSKKKDMLDWFLEDTDGEGHPLLDAIIKGFILNFTIAGRDTTAQALTWMFYFGASDWE